MVLRGYRLLACGLAVAVVLGGCTGGHRSGPSTAAATGRPIGAGVTVTGAQVPAGLAAAPDGSAVPAFGTGPAITDLVVPAVTVTPSGPLPAPVTLTFHVDTPVPTDGSVAIATAESPSGPWSLLQTTVSADGRSVAAQTDHLSLFGIIKVDIGEALRELKEQFLDGITGDFTTEATRPACADEARARAGGYTITSSTNGAVYWCLGLDGGKPVFKVVNRRRYPLAVAHPGLTFLRYAAQGVSLASLARFGSGGTTILFPFQEADFTVAVPAGGTGGISTQMSGPAQGLYQLQVGLETAGTILGRFGAGARSTFAQVFDWMGTALGDGDCVSALLQVDPGKILGSCFSAADLDRYFGWKGLLLAPFIAVGALLEFFRSEFDALGDQLDGRDRYAVTIARAGTVATNVILVRPVDGHSHLARGYTITKTVSGDCQPGSEVVDGAYRCFGTDNLVYDPCWADLDHPSQPGVVCLIQPWSTTVVRMLLGGPPDAPVGSGGDPTSEPPWGVQLSTGQRCLAVQGSHDSFGDQPVDYGCDGDLVLLRGFDEHGATWTVHTAHDNGGYTAGPVASVTAAWFGLADAFTG